MPEAPSMGVLSRFGTNGDTTSVAAAPTAQYEFLSQNLASERELIRNEGMRGTRLHTVTRQRKGRLTPSGAIEMEPGYGEMRTLFPLMVSVEAGAGPYTYTVTDTVPVAFQSVCDRVAKVFTYTGCRTSKVTFKSSPGQPLALSWEIEALNESIGAAGSVNWSGVTVSNTPPFVFHDAVVTINGTAYQIMDWEMTIDWMLKTDRWVNSQTRTDLPSQDLMIDTKFTLPYTSDTTGLYDLFTEAAELTTGVAGNITFTKGGVSLIFAWQGLLFPALKSPVVGARDEIVMQLASQSFRTAGGTAPLVVTLDPTV